MRTGRRRASFLPLMIATWKQHPKLPAMLHMEVVKRKASVVTLDGLRRRATTIRWP